MTPVGERGLARREQRIVVHAHAEDLQPALACQRVVDAQQDQVLAQHRQDQAKHRQPQFVQRPAGGGKEPVICRMMFGSDRRIGRQDHAGHRVPACEDPAGRDRQEALEGWRGHYARQRLQQIDKRRYKRHGSLLAQCLGLPTTHCQRGFSCSGTVVSSA